VWAFGRNGSQQLGIDRKGYREISPQPVTALSEKTIQLVTCGAEHSAALSIDGEVFMWGSNNYG